MCVSFCVSRCVQIPSIYDWFVRDACGENFHSVSGVKCDKRFNNFVSILRERIFICTFHCLHAWVGNIICGKRVWFPYLKTRWFLQREYIFEVVLNKDNLWNKRSWFPASRNTLLSNKLMMKLLQLSNIFPGYSALFCVSSCFTFYTEWYQFSWCLNIIRLTKEATRR